MSLSASWSQFCSYFLRYEDLGISLDVSRMGCDDGFLQRMEPQTTAAFSAMQALESGAIANPDEKRMVGHYWLRTPALAPEGLRADIEKDIADSKAFAAKVHSGAVAPPAGGKFTQLLVIGIGGSALGPQLVADALVDEGAAPVETHFFDNTDPDGLARIIRRIGTRLSHTLTVVISKSGGTPETRNGMLEAKAAYEAAGLDFSKHAVAVTGTAAGGISSKLEAYAKQHAWLHIFPMTDWVGGRTSIMSTVGLVPAALQGVDIDAFLRGAHEMDAQTRTAQTRENMAMMLALMWHFAGHGKGAKDMVVLPYKDRLGLFSKYLQQLVMESLGKEKNLAGEVVHQGIAVYGNKGSTDQHAYVQQLRDGVNNFFATLIEVREPGGPSPATEVEPGVTCADYLQGFIRGTRRALAENNRASMTISIAKVDAHSLGMLIALYERAVGFYAALVGVNAYHQPGVEAGKKAAGDFLSLLAKVRAAVSSTAQTAAQIAPQVDVEDTFHALMHLASTGSVTRTAGATPAEDTFRR